MIEERLTPGSILHIPMTRDTWECKAMIKTDSCNELKGDKYDLSFAAIEQACKQCSDALKPTQLIVSEPLALIAGRVAEKLGLTVILLKSVPHDYWALVFYDGAITIDCEGA